MKWNPNDPPPTPEQIAAWADGELCRADAERVEAWLFDHPDFAEESDPGRIVHLFRDYPPPEPSAHCWQTTFCRIVQRAYNPALDIRGERPSWKLRLFVGLAATVAVVGSLVVAQAIRKSNSGPGNPVNEIALAPEEVALPSDVDSDEQPFPVATMGEIDFLSISAEDADRVVIGQRLLGSFDVAGPDDIDIVKMEPDPEDGQMPRVQVALGVPMILVLRREPDPDDEP